MGFGKKAEKSTEEHSIFHFSETLSELMFERGNMTAKALAGQLHIAAPTLTRYLHAQRTPTVENLCASPIILPVLRTFCRDWNSTILRCAFMSVLPFRSGSHF